MLGVNPFEAMQRTTHREFLLWQWWFDVECEYPTGSDLYLMQIAQCVRQVLNRAPEKVKLKHFVLRRDRKKKPTPNDLELLKQQWFARVGGKPSGGPR